MARFTIVGAQGFIGGRLASHLAAHGHEVAMPARGALPAKDCGHVVYCAGVTADFRRRAFDTVAAHVTHLAEALSQSADVWIVSPFMENQFYPSVRVGMSELPTREWNASLENYLAGRGQVINEVRESFRSSNLDSLRFFCPLAKSFSYCKVPDAPLDRRTFAYGWKIIRVP